MRKIIGWAILIGWLGLISVVVGLSYMAAAGDYGYIWRILLCTTAVFFFLWLVLVD